NESFPTIPLLKIPVVALTTEQCLHFLIYVILRDGTISNILSLPQVRKLNFKQVECILYCLFEFSNLSNFYKNDAITLLRACPQFKFAPTGKIIAWLELVETEYYRPKIGDLFRSLPNAPQDF